MGGLVKSICISGCNDISNTLKDVIYKPTFRNKGAPDIQVEISLVVSRMDKHGISYATYKLLDKTVGHVPHNQENTISLLWKGPLNNLYRKNNKDYDTYLWFLVDSMVTDPQFIGIVDNDTPDITIVY